MKTPKFNLQRSLFFSLVLLTPLIAIIDLVRAENIDPRTSELATTKNSIEFSQNLGEKLQDGFLLVNDTESSAKKRKFKLFDNGPTFMRYIPPNPNNPTPTPQPKALPDIQSENASALQTFESLLG